MRCMTLPYCEEEALTSLHPEYISPLFFCSFIAGVCLSRLFEGAAYDPMILDVSVIISVARGWLTLSVLLRPLLCHKMFSLSHAIELPSLSVELMSFFGFFNRSAPVRFHLQLGLFLHQITRLGNAPFLGRDTTLFHDLRVRQDQISGRLI